MKEKIPEVMEGKFYWVKLFTDDKYEHVVAIKKDRSMLFRFIEGVLIHTTSVFKYMPIENVPE